jgi:hypothetical protein
MRRLPSVRHSCSKWRRSSSNRCRGQELSCCVRLKYARCIWYVEEVYVDGERHGLYPTIAVVSSPEVPANVMYDHLARPRESMPERSGLSKLANSPYATIPVPPSILLPNRLEIGCDRLPPMALVSVSPPLNMRPSPVRRLSRCEKFILCSLKARMSSSKSLTSSMILSRFLLFEIWARIPLKFS